MKQSIATSCNTRNAIYNHLYKYAWSCTIQWILRINNKKIRASRNIRKDRIAILVMWQLYCPGICSGTSLKATCWSWQPSLLQSGGLCSFVWDMKFSAVPEHSLVHLMERNTYNSDRFLYCLLSKLTETSALPEGPVNRAEMGTRQRQWGTCEGTQVSVKCNTNEIFCRECWGTLCHLCFSTHHI